MSDNPRPYIDALRLNFVAENYEALATEAAKKHWSHVEYPTKLMEGMNGESAWFNPLKPIWPDMPRG